jgi:hypothetical protein
LVGPLALSRPDRPRRPKARTGIQPDAKVNIALSKNNRTARLIGRMKRARMSRIDWLVT